MDQAQLTAEQVYDLLHQQLIGIEWLAVYYTNSAMAHRRYGKPPTVEQGWWAALHGPNEVQSTITPTFRTAEELLQFCLIRFACFATAA